MCLDPTPKVCNFNYAREMRLLHLSAEVKEKRRSLFAIFIIQVHIFVQYCAHMHFDILTLVSLHNRRLLLVHSF